MFKELMKEIKIDWQIFKIKWSERKNKDCRAKTRRINRAINSL